MEKCPLSDPTNFERSDFFLVLKAAVAQSVIEHCLQCKKYPQCQPDFQLLPKSGSYIMETLESELGGPAYLDDFEEI